MYTVLALGYEFVTEFVPFFIVMLLFRRNRGKYVTPFSKRHYFAVILFTLYIMAVFHVTGAGTIYNAMTGRIGQMKERINWIPFSRTIDPVGYGLNVVMFLPFGFLVPMIWKKMGKASVLTAGFSFSLLIELSQLFSYRGTDVDDLIMNTLGAAVGLWMYRIWDNLTKSKFQLDGIPTIELPAYILTIFLGRFLLFHQVGLIHLIYGG